MLLEFFIFGVVTFLMTGVQCEVAEVLVEVGSQAILPCKCSTSLADSSAVVWTQANKGTVWRKQKSGLQYWGAGWSTKETQRVRCLHSQFERGDYSLQINNVREEDAGIFSCRVENRKYVTENVVMLRIIKVSFSPSVPLLNNDVSISCDVTPWPYGATVQWKLNNSPFESRSRITSNRNSAESAVREKATERLTGKWTCVVGYKGKVGQALATLTVKGIMQPPKDNTKVYAAVGSAVTLPCVFSPGLIPSGTIWEKLKPESHVKSGPGHLVVPFVSENNLKPNLTQSNWSVTLKEVGFEDEGMYRCSGTAEGQLLTRNMQLVVAKINKSVPTKKKGSLTLTCELSDTSEVTDYEWVHVSGNLNGTESIGSVQKGKTVKISIVSENQGEWTCRFYGKEGILGNVTYYIQAMSGLSGQKSSGVSQNTGAVVALSFLLFVLLLVLVKMYKNHQRRKRILQYPALEAIVHTTSNEREERERTRGKK
uniref:lymphocyte activation gene 3 protein-like n=1 Tax=Scatophagus argus TaxID=75038 RepID=UPI001ED7FF9C|nr:lymphocyte activation gene 3 protein-like [Scatophagus argus]